MVPAEASKAQALRAPETQLFGIVSALPLNRFIAVACISVVAHHEPASREVSPVLWLRLLTRKLESLRCHPRLFECYDLFQDDVLRCPFHDEDMPLWIAPHNGTQVRPAEPRAPYRPHLEFPTAQAECARCPIWFRPWHLHSIWAAKKYLAPVTA